MFLHISSLTAIAYNRSTDDLQKAKQIVLVSNGSALIKFSAADLPIPEISTSFGGRESGRSFNMFIQRWIPVNCNIFHDSY